MMVAIKVQTILIAACIASFRHLHIFTEAIKSSPPEVNMGTTILAVRYKDGVVVGADSRTSVSGYVSNRIATKISFVLENDFGISALPPSSTMQLNSAFLRNPKIDANIADTADTANMNSKNERSDSLIIRPNSESSSTCCICRSGSAADTQYLADVIRHQLLRRRILHSTPSCVSEVAHLIKNYVKNDESLTASLICAGYDHVKDEGLIFSIDLGGTIMEQGGWACSGSGSSYILGMIDDAFPKGSAGNESDYAGSALWNEEEAVSFVKRAIELAMERDGSSGGVVRVFIVNKEGKKGLIHIPDSNCATKSPSNTVLPHFAPATRRTIVK